MNGSSPSTDRPRQLPLILGLGFSAAIFTVDLGVPLGYATGVLHLLPLLTLLWSRVRWHVFVVAAAATAFTMLDISFGAPGEPRNIVLINRGLSLLALWTVALLVWRHLRDIYEREAAAAERGHMVTAMLQAAPDGMLLVDHAGLVAVANPAAERIFGYPSGGLHQLPLERLLPEDPGKSLALTAAAFQARASGERTMAPNTPMRGVQRDGKAVPLEVTLAHLQGGDPLAVLSLRDVSEKLRIEERLHTTQRMEAIGKLAGGVAHDFNNMLTAIICNARLARETLPPGAPAHEDVDEILLAADRAADLTRQLLAFSRKQIIEPRNINLNEIVQQTHRMLLRLLGDDVRQELHLAPDLGTVRVDPSQLEQVLLNLTVNARDAMRTGGTLTVETSNVTLDARYAAEHSEVEPGEYVLLAVTDTGHGMTSEVRVRIFEPFFTTKPAGIGSGLGLATVYGALKQAGGHVWVYSEPGKGSTFRVYLPRTHDPAEPVRPAREPAKPVGGAEVVLVVEDEPALRRILVRTLSGAGYTVLEAANGEDALLKLQSWPDKFDLLLTDVVMPQMGGADLARKVLERYPDIPVLYASGYTENAIVHRGQLDPGVVFLQKPFTPDEVLRRVRQVLDESRRPG